MGRRPGVFVRPVSMEEGRRVQRIGRISKDPVRLRRAIVVLMSAQGQPVRIRAWVLQSFVVTAGVLVGSSELPRAGPALMARI